jgi:hypothetical protein
MDQHMLNGLNVGMKKMTMMALWSWKWWELLTVDYNGYVLFDIEEDEKIMKSWMGRYCGLQNQDGGWLSEANAYLIYDLAFYATYELLRLEDMS